MHQLLLFSLCFVLYFKSIRLAGRFRIFTNIPSLCVCAADKWPAMRFPINKGMLFNSAGQVFVTAAGGSGYLAICDTSCPNMGALLYTLIVIAGISTMSVIMMYYCWQAFHGRRKAKREGPSTAFIESMIGHTRSSAVNASVSGSGARGGSGTTAPRRRAAAAGGGNRRGSAEASLASSWVGAGGSESEIHRLLHHLDADSVMTPRAVPGDFSTTMHTSTGTSRR